MKKAIGFKHLAYGLSASLLAGALLMSAPSAAPQAQATTETITGEAYTNMLTKYGTVRTLGAAYPTVYYKHSSMYSWSGVYQWNLDMWSNSTGQIIAGAYIPIPPAPNALHYFSGVGDIPTGQFFLGTMIRSTSGTYWNQFSGKLTYS